MNQTVAIFGATGAQGAPVVQEALAKGLTVRAVARDEAKISEMHGAAQAFAVTLDDVDAIARALDGANAAFLHLPAPTNPEDPQTWMTTFLTAAHQVKLPLLVFTTGGTAGDRYPSSTMIDGMTGGMMGVLNSGIPSIVLQPTIYLENLLPGFLTPQLKSEGVLAYPPLPETLKVTWTSHFDQARVAVAALTRPDLAGQNFEIGTPAPLTGGQLAELLSGWVDRPVSFAPQSPEALGAQVAEAFGNQGMGHMLTDMYGALAKMGDDDMCIDTRQVEETFGVTLSTVEEHIKSWGKASAAA